MKPLEFLATVLPSPGHGFYCVAAFTPKRKTHKFVGQLADARPFIKPWLQDSKDIYFALATFDDPQDGRTANNALHVKSLFIDMDGYETKRAAGEALNAFLVRTGLDKFGTPHVVASGGGIHCYWPLDEEATVAEWKPVAESLKRLCKQENLRIDMTVTADAARVLRIPGTFNFKPKYPEPRPVKLLTVGDACVNLRKFGAAVRAQLQDAGTNIGMDIGGLRLAGTKPTKDPTTPSALGAALVGNLASKFQTIWLKTERGVGCAQLDYYTQNPQADGLEPLWRGLLSLAKVCDDGREYAEKLTDLRPYPRERMEQKLNEIKGPYPCIKFDSENPGVCSGCAHWGRITNPLALGREVAVDNAPKKIQIPVQGLPAEPGADADDEDDVGAPAASPQRTFMRPLPPKGFDYGKHGGVYRTVELEDANGQKSQVQVPVLNYDLYVVDTLRMEEKEMHAHLMAVRPYGEANDEGERQQEYVPIILPHKTAVSKDEMLKVLASHGVLAAHGQVNDKYLFDYVRGALAIATQARKAVDVPIQFGWQKDRSFVYNNRVFKADGTITPVPMPGLENINRITNSKGTLFGWQRFWNLMIERKMHTMLALCLDAFGSTLMHFSEYEGFVWHIGSTESGTGKSLTLTAKAGVWGHPIRYRTGKGTSQVAMQQRAGLLNSMPLLIDEITTKTRNDVEWTPEFIFNISEGQGKERMEAGANKERVNNSTWALTCTMTSNTHMIDILTGARKHSSHGEVMRMLEWTPTQALKFSPAEHEILREVRQNYGVAGEAWVQYQVKNYNTVKSVWGQVHGMLKEKLGFSDEERYWHAACTSTVAAGVLLGSKYSGILDVPVRSVVDALRELVEKARVNHKHSARNAEDVLNTYTRDHYGKFVIVRRDELGQAQTDLGLDAATKHSTRNTVMGRIELNGPLGVVEYFIEEQLLRQHCAACSFGYADFQRQMSAGEARMQRIDAKYKVKFGVRKNLLANTDGPALRVNCMHVVVPQALVNEDGSVPVA